MNKKQTIINLIILQNNLITKPNLIFLTFNNLQWTKFMKKLWNSPDSENKNQKDYLNSFMQQELNLSNQKI